MFKIRFYYPIVLCMVGFVNISYGLKNLAVSKSKVESYYLCGKYDNKINKIVDKAIRHFAKVACPFDKTVIFDIDDTVLSTFNLEKSIQFGYVHNIAIAAENRGKLPAIPATKRLYDFIVDRGFHVVFISGRTSEEYEATRRNLIEQGFTKFDAIIMRSPEEIKLTAQNYKKQWRKQLEKDGYSIASSVGDQWSDLCGGHAGYQVKLPNYMYILK